MKTSKFPSLTASEAKEILDKRPYERTLPPCRLVDPDVAEILAPHADTLDYDNVVELSADAARHIVGALENGEESTNWPDNDDRAWRLNGLRELPVDLAEVLSGFSMGPLHLDGLTSISPEAAKHLYVQCGLLTLNGLTAVTPDLLCSLMTTGRGVALNSLHTLGPEFAAAIDDVTDDATDDRRKLYGPPQWQLQLNGIRFLPDVVAESLVRCARHMRSIVSDDRWSPIVTLDGLVALDAPLLARAITFGENPVIRAPLRKIQWVSARAARELTRWNHVDLPAVERLTPTIARNFARTTSTIALGGVSELPDGVAEEFGRKRGGGLYLGGLACLTPHQVGELAKAPLAALALNAFKSLDLAVAEALGRSAASSLVLRGLEHIDAAAAEALSQFQGSFDLNAMVTTARLPALLERPLSKLLARHKGAITLRGIQNLTPEAAEDLAGHGGPHMHLDDVARVFGGVARHLAHYKGKLSLCGVRHLSDEAAAALSQYEGWALILRGLEALSPEQRELLSRNPRIKLPGD